MKSFFPSIFHRDDPRSAMDNIFNDFSREWLSSWPNSRLDKHHVIPAIDVKEYGEYFEIKAELPDMNEKDIEVDIQGTYLSIRGEKKYEQESDEKGYHLRERSFGTFHRQIPLGFNVDVELVTAKYAKGVLSIHVPKPVEMQHDVKKIKVKFEE
ncbi:heat shock protein HSP20 [Shewanella sediminis HAW-EB3]|uniref:Heat shock protein HSP20 n=1 Tax=Shewanella sediminis (strain HAW-EB3) TaxID=425104 RepID=A8FR24_SHESH|nr:Hsp20/alpha crystallin family protein [Shewanella sediminis]ABV35297.1 heat shock protein HSP20 [Shewanella sediminis HAW-EB3]